MNDINSLFTDSCISYIQENKKRVHHCFQQLNEGQLWRIENENLNSVGNLILHLNGNISQYVLSSLGGQKDERNRESEFKERPNINKSDLLALHDAVINNAIGVIRNLDPNELSRSRSVQGFDMTGMEVLIHVTEHYSYHTGQIAFITKLYNNKDLDFYKGFDLNLLNE